MKRISPKVLAETVLLAEVKTGREFSSDTIQDVLQHSCRKLRVINKDLEYLPVLFESELTNYAMAEQLKGARANV